MIARGGYFPLLALSGAYTPQLGNLYFSSVEQNNLKNSQIKENDEEEKPPPSPPPPPLPPRNQIVENDDDDEPPPLPPRNHNVQDQVEEENNPVPLPPPPPPPPPPSAPVLTPEALASVKLRKTPLTNEEVESDADEDDAHHVAGYDPNEIFSIKLQPVKERKPTKRFLSKRPREENIRDAVLAELLQKKPRIEAYEGDSETQKLIEAIQKHRAETFEQDRQEKAAKLRKTVGRGKRRRRSRIPKLQTRTNLFIDFSDTD